MRTIPKRIQNAYFQLHKSRLISKGHLDNDAINHFQKILNSSLPVNEYEQNIYYFIKDLYYDNPSKFLQYISNSNLQCLLLYTNNKNIINHFNLQYKVYINWCSKEKLYIVELYSHQNSISSGSIISKNSSSNSLISPILSDNELLECENEDEKDNNLIQSFFKTKSLDSLNSSDDGIV